MSDAHSPDPAGSSDTGGASAGALLRSAREKQGLHIAALAASIKIPQRKLEALESDRFDELPDATFARALAMTVCRALKIDAAPVLAQLPRSGAAALADVAGGLNAPYRDRAGRGDPVSLGLMRHPLAWAAGLVLLAAAALFLSPPGWWQALLSDGPPVASAPAVQASAVPAPVASEPAASAALGMAPAVADAASEPAVEVVHSVPAADTRASAVAEGAAGLVVVRASEASWIEVIDAAGQVLVRRVVQPGESLGLDGTLPFKLRIGNAAATQLQFRGQPFDLGPSTKDNIARLELN